MSVLTHSLVFILSLFVSISTHAANKIVPLKEARTALVLPDYSANDRQTLANQALFFIKNLYVHRELKLKDFPNSGDAVARLEVIAKKAKDLSNEELHQSISNVFLDLHDLHTNYYAPAPLSCGMTFVPLRFEWVKEGNADLVLVSRRLSLKKEATEGIEIGDELLSINGRSTQELINELTQVSGGANEDSMHTRAVQMLSFRSLVTQAVPQEDVLTFRFKGKDKEYEKEIPWFALLDETCIKNGGRSPERRGWEIMNLSEDDFQKKYNRLFGTPSIDDAKPTWFARRDMSEIFQVALLDTPGGKIGYVQLKSFYWSSRSLDVATVIEALRSEIESHLNESIGLVIDVRGNPGGLIVFAEKLVQLFSHEEVEPSTVRMLANSLNEQIFLKANGGQDNRWSKAIRDAVSQKKLYTKPLAITPSSEANSSGQVWYRPVVVLTDASCYSACDLFAAGMQDAGAGVIIGLHRNTGAGGANVMEYNVFKSIMGSSNNPFETLPFGQNMRVSWRQAIRTKGHLGELIEDKGIKSDIVVPLKRGDVGSESKEMMKQVHRIVDELAPKYTSGMGVRRGSYIPLENGKEARWTEQVYGADRVDVFVNSKKLTSIPLALSAEAKPVEFNIADLNGEWLDQPVVLVGKKANKNVFRTVRELMWRGEYTPLSEEDAIKVDFDSEKIEPFHTVLLKGSENSGWQVRDGQLRIGKGPLYEPLILARAFTSLKLEGKGGKMTLDIGVEAEDLNDSLRFYAVNPETGERINFFAGSELSPKIGVSIPLPDEWDRADVFLEFESDENWNMKGPFIDNVKLVR